jgi:virulence-associated protein VapD
MSYKILLGDTLYTINRFDNEPESIFLQRANFIINGINKDIMIDKLTTLSLCYRNIIQYKVEYNEDIDNIIKEILNI